MATDNRWEKVYKMSVASVYPHYITKALKNGRTEAEVNKIIYWLTGYSELELQNILVGKVSFEHFFEAAPNFNAKAYLINGSICGDKIQDIVEPLRQKIRMLDKLVDDLAKGKSIEKILFLDK
jgi:hypothetical protein